MEIPLTPMEDIRSILDKLRQDPNTQRRFPQELWASIIQLTKIHPIKEICQSLQISPVYLKRKIYQSKEQVLEFHQISVKAPPLSSDMVTIELSSNGINAKIQGPISCLSYLHKLFGR